MCGAHAAVRSLNENDCTSPAAATIVIDGYMPPSPTISSRASVAASNDDFLRPFIAFALAAFAFALAVFVAGAGRVRRTAAEGA